MNFKVLILTFLVSATTFGATISETSSHIIYEVPFNQFTISDHQEAIEDSINYGVDMLKVWIGSDKIDSDSVADLKQTNKERMPELLKDLQSQVERKNTGFSVNHLNPAAYMFMVGGKASLNFKVGGAVSGTFAFIVSPTKVFKINKIKKTVRSQTTFKASVVFFPDISIGGGIGGSTKGRVGLGFLWGDLENPSEVYGGLTGASGTVNVGIGGLNINGGLIIRGNKSPLIFNSWMLEFGPAAEASIHGNLGAVFPLQKHIEGILGISPELKDGDVDEEILATLRDLVQKQNG